MNKDEELKKINNIMLAWEKYEIENNIYNPFQEIYESWANYTIETIDSNGSKIFIHKPKPKEQIFKDKKLTEDLLSYTSKRQLWEGQQILKTYGYNTLMVFVQLMIFVPSCKKSEDTEICNHEFWEWFNNIPWCERIGKNS